MSTTTKTTEQALDEALAAFESAFDAGRLDQASSLLASAQDIGRMLDARAHDWPAQAWRERLRAAALRWQSRGSVERCEACGRVMSRPEGSLDFCEACEAQLDEQRRDEERERREELARDPRALVDYVFELEERLDRQADELERLRSALISSTSEETRSRLGLLSPARGIR